MKRIYGITALALMGFLAGTASAQPKPKKPTKPAAAAAEGDAAAAAPRVKNFDFDADLINGELIKPDGDQFVARTRPEHGNLIRVRVDFIREIVKSAEDL